MAILLFTDYGANTVYPGQVELALERDAPGVRVVHLMHEAPAFKVRAGAHLLAAQVQSVPPGHVWIAVVDPGVGGERGALALHAGGNWFTGPDNGLMSVVVARARTAGLPTRIWRLARMPEVIAASFHGRDVFAPLAASIARGRFPGDDVVEVEGLEVDFGPDDLAEIIHVDRFGNAMTGLRAATAPEYGQLLAGGRYLERARTFGDVEPGEPFWYANSQGLIEVAANQADAAGLTGLAVGDPVRWLA